MKLLVISPYFPYPADSGGNTRVFNLLKQLGSHHVECILALVTSEKIDPAQVEAFRGLLPHVRVVQLPYTNRPLTKAAYFLLSLAGLGGLCFRETRRAIAQLIERDGIDLVEVIYAQAARYLPRTHPPAVLVMIEFRSQVAARELALRRGAARAAAYLRYRLLRHEELSGLTRYQRVVCMSEADRALMRVMAPGVRADVIENGVDVQLYAIEPQLRPEGLYFLGWFMNRQNSIALDFLLDRIWPRLGSDAPNMVVIGKDLDGSRRARLAAMNIPYLGYLETPDLRKAVRGRILLVPLFTGGGTRLKILEAMALGNPVISTAIGIEGIEAAPGTHYLKAESADDFVQAIRRLFAEPGLWEELSRNARRFVEEKYDWKHLADKQLALYQEMLGEAGAA